MDAEDCLARLLPHRLDALAIAALLLRFRLKWEEPKPMQILVEGRLQFGAAHFERWVTMFRTSLFLLALSATGCAGAQAIDADENWLIKGFPSLPADARQVIERLAECNHWAGETGDNPPDREREIREAVVELRCDRIEQDVAAIRAKYRGNEQVAKAIAAAEDF